jgi:hypothetical protein
METQIQAVQTDIAEMKQSLQSLASGQVSILTQLAINADREKNNASNSASNGVWVRWGVPTLITAPVTLITLYHLLVGTTT